MTTPTTRQLSTLKPGAQLTVRLRSGRVIQAQLAEAPEWRTAGPVGPGRVSLSVCDLEVWPLGTYSMTSPLAQGRHNVTGAQVVSVA